MTQPLTPPDPPLGDGTIVLRVRRDDDVAAIAIASRDPETFVIADAGTDRVIGLLNLRLDGDREVGGLAVSVFPTARGRGVASRALRLAADWALRDVGLQRVFAEAAVDNTASVRAIERAGFHREGTLRSHCTTHGVRHDCVMFSLVPGDLRRDLVSARDTCFNPR